MTYNGHKNYETWNVLLWINNDEGLYTIAKSAKDYNDFVSIVSQFSGSIGFQTPDGVAWNDSGIDVETINADWVQDFVEDVA